MTAVANFLEQLTPLVGVEHVIARESSFVVSPANTEEVASVLTFANRHGLKVQPTGGRTKLSWGNPVEADIELSLLRMNRVLEHSWQDLVCRVQAGCTWETMQQQLAQHGQFVALDPLWPAKATVGGIVATNDSGAIRHRYGSLRDLIIGMTIVLADGTIARSGGKVVKNVAGYDLPKLMTGSLGTLAIITEVNFRLYPLPQHLENFTISASKAEQLAPLMQSIRDSHLLTQALQLRGDGSGFHLDVQLNAHPEAKQKDVLANMAQKESLHIEVALHDVWNARTTLSNNYADVNKVTMLPVKVATTAQQIIDKGGECVAQSLGILHSSLPVEEATINKDVLLLMQAIKHQFDPNHTLNELSNHPSIQPSN